MLSLRFLRRRRILYFSVLAIFLLSCLATLKIISSTDENKELKLRVFSKQEREEIIKRFHGFEVGGQGIRETDAKKNKTGAEINQPPTVTAQGEELFDVQDKYGAHDGSLPEPNYNVHIFYYAWYGNPEHDGKYIHWNHRRLPHWDPNVAKNYNRHSHSPPDDIGSNFYPQLGTYSSRDLKVIKDHMRQMRTAGVGVIVLSWYPPGKADDEGIPSDALVPLILKVAAEYKLKVTLHIEPYRDRNDQTLHDDVKYIVDTYSEHDAFYKYKTVDGRYLPMLYIYDSYQTPADAWAQLMKPDGSHSVRNTPYDCIFIALLVEMNHRQYLDVGGFDGFYTYFATDKFTYGSTWRFWPHLETVAEQTNTLFIPSVGPGYIDTMVRPWNNQNTRLRNNGEYYKNSCQAALQTITQIISITSFNEWHEGTQIEKAVPKALSGFEYKDYSPHSPDFYLKLTKELVFQFNLRKNKV